MKRAWVVVGAVAVIALAALWLTGEPAVRQPAEFPHKAHLELKEQKLECTSCHDRAEKGSAAGRPSTKKCLSCHSGAEAKSAEEKKLQAFGERGQEIPWRRVWRLPSDVFFSHRTHVAVAKVRCQTCHGPMETVTRALARPLQTLTMDDCIGCHEQWEGPTEAGEKGADKGGRAERAVQANAVARKVSTDCAACHR